jgi:hypothetical protein
MLCMSIKDWSLFQIIQAHPKVLLLYNVGVPAFSVNVCMFTFPKVACNEAKMFPE